MRSFDSNFRGNDSKVEGNVSKLWANVSIVQISDSPEIGMVAPYASGAVNVAARLPATCLDMPAT
ncbi:hypothetical protein ATY78_01385 [Rhizobium sp. R635]|nr:hypothetical protein ATY78_01385 [Rhizobium sp. R635]